MSYLMRIIAFYLSETEICYLIHVELFSLAFCIDESIQKKLRYQKMFYEYIMKIVIFHVLLIL